MNDQETYSLTPFGLLAIHLGTENARIAVDALELRCRKFNIGLAIDGGDLGFVQLERVDGKGEK